MDNSRVYQTDKEYPQQLTAMLGAKSPDHISFAGNYDLINKKKLAVFVSAQCSGATILQTYEFVRKLRQHDISFVSGFHSPMEKECMRTISGGEAGIIWFLAKSLKSFSLHPDFNSLFDSGRMLILSPFADSVTRIKKETAVYRNSVAAALADEIFLPFATPESKTEKFCLRLLSLGKPVFTLDTIEAQNIIDRGAQPVCLNNIDSLWGEI